jgi:hypothetical protein
VDSGLGFNTIARKHQLIQIVFEAMLFNTTLTHERGVLTEAGTEK